MDGILDVAVLEHLLGAFALPGGRLALLGAQAEVLENCQAVHLHRTAGGTALQVWHRRTLLERHR